MNVVCDKTCSVGTYTFCTTTTTTTTTTDDADNVEDADNAHDVSDTAAVFQHLYLSDPPPVILSSSLSHSFVSPHLFFLFVLPFVILLLYSIA